jgi:hypothetical protein
MKHFIKLLLLFLLVMLLEIAYNKSAYAALTLSELNFDMSSRASQLNWNIAADLSGQTTPNILSELTWTDIATQVFDIHAKAIFNDRISATGFLSYGLIYQGANQDSDYLSNNRSGEFSRSNNNASDGSTFDFSLALMYQFTKTEQWTVSGLFGFSCYNQYLKITDGYQTISLPPQTTPLGSFPGLDSSYSASWNGPWVGLTVDFYISEGFSLDGNLEYHIVDYSGEGNWNLRTDLAHPVSFSHLAQGSGAILSAGINYKFTDQWSAGLSLESGSWSTGAGTDIVYGADDSYGITRLNQVNWSFFEVTLKLILLPRCF